MNEMVRSVKPGGRRYTRRALTTLARGGAST
jgi:hypothetical protein